MPYDYEFMDGFDKYGPVGTTYSNTSALTDFSGTIGDSSYIIDLVTVSNSLLGPGTSVLIQNRSSGSGSGWSYLSKNLDANCARTIGGCFMSNNLAAGDGECGWTWVDGSTPQFSLKIERATGKIAIVRGAILGGTVIATSDEAVAVDQSNCIEWDITFNNTTGAYKIWLNGVLTSLSATGVDTCSTANDYITSFGPALSTIIGDGGRALYDHYYNRFYIAASSGDGETPCLTNPVIETQFPSADDSVQFTPGAGILGTTVRSIAGTTLSAGLYLKKFTPVVSCTLNSISFMTNNFTSKFTPVLYSSSGGNPASLIATGIEVSGVATNVTATLLFSTGQSLAGGVSYFIGFINESTVTVYRQDTSTFDTYSVSNTYSSGAPASAAAATSGSVTIHLYGNISGSAANYLQVAQNPTQGDLSYNSSSTVGQEDLFTFPAMTSIPVTVYSVAVKANIARTDAGARTVDLRTKSGATTTSGSDANQSPATSYGWIASYYKNDPNTGLPWGVAATNAAKHGIKIIT